MKNIAFILLLMMTTWITHAQDNNIEKFDNKEQLPLNTITAGIGGARDVTNLVSFSNLGFDYLRRINPRWEWGIQLDLDWEKNFTKFDGIALAGIVAYSITNEWPVFGGLGIALEKEHKDVFIRVGTEYTFFLNAAQSVFLAPGTFVDLSPNAVTVSAMIVIGWMW